MHNLERKRLHTSLELSRDAVDVISNKQTRRRRKIAATKAPAAPVSTAAPSSDDVIDAILSAPSEESTSPAHAAVPIASASDVSSTDSATTPVLQTANSVVINTYWRKFLDAAALNEDFHMFSAEKNGVVLVGKGIKQDSLMDKAEYENLITELEFFKNQMLDAEGKNLLKVVFFTASVEAMNHAVRSTPGSSKNHAIQDICTVTVSLIKYGELCKFGPCSMYMECSP